MTLDWSEANPSQGSKSSLESLPRTVVTAAGMNERCTFVSIADIELKNEDIADFKKWFSEINRTVLSQYKGFLGRVLIESPDGKSHKILFMTEDKESFLAIRASPQHKELHAKALTFMTKPPVLSFYNIAAM